MVDRVQVGARVDSEVYEEFKQYVKDEAGASGGSIGRELERAMKDRMEAEDSLSTIQKQLDRIEAKQDELIPDDTGGAPTSSSESLEREKLSDSNSSTETEGYGGRTEKKIQAIAADLPDDTKVKEYVVEAAIEDNAGTSFKTIQKYKRLLHRRGYAIQHPVSEDMYYTSPTPLVISLELGSGLSDEAYRSFVRTMRDFLGDNWYLEAIPEKTLRDWLIDGDGLRYDEVVDGVKMSSEEYAIENGIIDRDDGRSFQ